MPPRVALVHDFLLDLRGAERVFAAICDAWPEADVFTAVYDEDGTEGRFAARRPRTSFLQRLRPTSRTFRPLLPLYPHADRVVRPARLRHRDLLVERVGARRARRPGRGARLLLPQPVPLRLDRSARRRCAPATRSCGPVLRVLLNRWRQWDWIAAQRVDRYVANSHLTAARVRRYFGRESTVLYPPGGDGALRAGPVGGHYMVLAELMAHKRIDVAVRAFNALRRPLLVVGDGPELRAAQAPGGADGHVHRTRQRRARGRAARSARALVVMRHGGVRDRRGRGARRRPAGDRPGRGRRARERPRGRDRDVLRALRARGAGRDGGRVRSARDRPGRLPRRRGAVRRRALPWASCGRSSPRPSGPSAPPRPGERPRSGASPVVQRAPRRAGALR